MAIRRLQRMGRSTLIQGASLASLLLGSAGTSMLYAQQSPSSAQVVSGAAATPVPQRIFWRKNVIQLPIQINEQFRNMIQEVQLYVKDQPGAPWELRDKWTPNQKAFTFHAPRDGEFQFAMVTVDKQGRSIPSDLRHEPPGMIVVFDTQAPQIELTDLGTGPEGQLIRFEGHDENLNQAKTRLSFQGGDKQFRELEQMPGRPNVYCIPSQAVFNGTVRVNAEDLAGNVAFYEGPVRQMRVANASGTAPSPKTDVLPTPVVPVAPNRSGEAPRSTASLPRTLPTELLPAAGVERPTETPTLLPQTQARTVSRGEMQATDGPRLGDAPQLPSTMSLPLPAVQKEAPRRQLVNRSKLFLDFQVENGAKGESGKVEVWITRDEGRSWKKHCEDPHGKSPVEIQLPEDGKYGITLVVTNAQGVGSPFPFPGDTPDWLIELDTAKPTAEITKVEVLKEHGTPVVQVAWTAQDSNLGDGPVELVYSATTRGPWLPIAKGLKAEGLHRWTPPATIGAQVYIRVIAHDLAGNESIAATLEPVRLVEEARPRIQIQGIRTEAPGSPDKY